MSTIVRENPLFVSSTTTRDGFGTVKPIVPSDDEWDFAKTTIREFYNSALEMNTVLDGPDFRELKLLPWARYDDWANFFNEAKPDTANVHKTALISDSVFIRTALNAFFALYTAVRPTTFVSTPEEAVVFAQSEMCASQ